jgi:hypothetical protein
VARVSRRVYLEKQFAERRQVGLGQAVEQSLHLGHPLPFVDAPGDADHRLECCRNRFAGGTVLHDMTQQALYSMTSHTHTHTHRQRQLTHQQTDDGHDAESSVGRRQKYVKHDFRVQYFRHADCGRVATGIRRHQTQPQPTSQVGKKGGRRERLDPRQRPQDDETAVPFS